MPSYRKSHIKSKIHKIKPKKSIFKGVWLLFLILFLIILVSVLYLIFFYSGFQLKNISISGNSKVKTQDLQNIVSQSANTGLINFASIKVVSRSIFLINDDKLKKEILKQFPEIEKLTINKNLPQSMSLGVTERKPLGVFCQASSTNPSLQNNSGCFLIDQNGVIFDPLSIPIAGDTIVRQSLNGGQAFTGEQVINQNIISAIYKIQEYLKNNFQINLTDALVTSPVRLDVTTNTATSWKIYFDLDPSSDLDVQLSELNSLLNGQLTPDSKNNLRYIDLRPKNRAIVCDNKVCGG